jgi:glycosyltransferase involved in cell wall biosynthesis
MNILHTESSPGWGGQELRILKEAEGMRARGHQIFFALQKESGLVKAARQAGFRVDELSFSKKAAFSTFFHLLRLIRTQRIDIINTHSSMDAWIGGIAGKISRCPVIRTRHLSTPIRKGLNSKLLYNKLADYVVTTCSSIVPFICKQANLPKNRCLSIPTGVNPHDFSVTHHEVAEFRKSLDLDKNDILVGTLCVLRGWKGISDFLHAASLLKNQEHIKWMIVGSGVSEAHFKMEWKALGLEKTVYFAGFLSPPFIALASMDIFLLLSWANEGVSQASLQAAWLEKPLITTPTGGLCEVCIPEKTGIQVGIHSPHEVAQAVEKLSQSLELRQKMGREAKALVLEKFTFEKTLDEMENVYHLCRQTTS